MKKKIFLFSYILTEEFLQNKNKKDYLRNNYIGVIEIIYLRKGREFMKKIIAVVAVIVLVGSMVLVLGDIVTDVSEGVSDMVTDMSEDVSRMIR